MAKKNQAFARRLEDLITSRFSGNASELARTMGCTRAAVANWRAGQVPSDELLGKLASLVGKDVEWLLYGMNRVEPRWSTTDDPETVRSSNEVGQVLERAQRASTPLERAQYLFLFLRLSLEPRLRDLYGEKGWVLADAQSQTLMNRTVDIVGETQFGREWFTVDQWPLLAELVVRCHEDALVLAALPKSRTKKR